MWIDRSNFCQIFEFIQISRIAYGICGGYGMECHKYQGLNELDSESVMKILLPKAGLNELDSESVMEILLPKAGLSGPELQEYELPMTESQHLGFFYVIHLK